MNKFGVGVLAVLFGALIVAVSIGLKYSHATVFFGLVAASAAPVVIHKIPNQSLSLGLLMALSLFASFPLKKLFQIDGFIHELPVTLVYAGMLWLIGFGWKRS